jgi:hypothetical protein
MDNQQATSSETDLAYFAGIIDGEGWIGLQKRFERNRFTTYKPTIRVTNTDANIIERIQEIWLKLGVNGHLYETTQGPSVANGKPVMYLQIQKQTLLKKTLEAVLPYLVGKRARAAMLLRFVDKTVDREEAYQMIRAANQKGVLRGESSEAKSDPSNDRFILEEDMVHPAEKSGG